MTVYTLLTVTVYTLRAAAARIQLLRGSVRGLGFFKFRVGESDCQTRVLPV
jgi:hypothetical protein